MKTTTRGTSRLSPCSLLRLCWLLLCLGLMVWQTIRCSQELLLNPIVTNIEYRKFSDEFLPQITVCPYAPQGMGLLKDDELAKHGLDTGAYLWDKNNFQWASQNRSLKAEEVEKKVTWSVEELVKSVEWYEVGGGLETVEIEDIAHLWTPAKWSPSHYACYKLDLRKIRNSSARLEEFIVNSKFPGGIQLHLHKVDQAYDKSLGTSVNVKSEPKFFPRYVPHTGVDVSLKVIRTLSTSKQPCSSAPYDSSFMTEAMLQMMAVAGCVVPWVDRRKGAPICQGGEEAKKAFEVYNSLNRLGLYEKTRVAPPCEFFIPTIKESAEFSQNLHNATGIVSVIFAPQVNNDNLKLAFKLFI